ncbi:hypothetical protein BXZ70DRAFT_999671 [Cristinia sonorae]|uniref:Peptidase M20 domain-containing protein 2 n=1 Tax=Cristinia sonorae TaxID=1940300 RepID=A0A8K0XQY3_9AGAR|nr:hypothetical protein BXZ70DRAFT_999671 [Cristinia sonorae]
MCRPVKSNPADIWRLGQDAGLPKGSGAEIYRPDLFETIESRIDDLESSLKALSLDISDHPELKFEEFYAHDVLTKYMENHGFAVKRKYILETGWEARWSHGAGGRTIGINSEMDALPAVGHACGHNLIAIAGVAVALAVKQVLQDKNIPGTVILLGTPGQSLSIIKPSTAEEGGHGKVNMLEGGAYAEMHACLMQVCHPAPGPPWSGSLSSSLALRQIEAEYHGRTAHAALAPWEGKNAMDAAVAAYNNISLLRQQLKPDNRVQGIITGRGDWAVNVIPDYSKLSSFTVRVSNTCIRAAGHATGCKVDIQKAGWCYDLRQNEGLGEEFASVFKSKYGPIDYTYGIASASTDFVSAMPALHPGFAIPTEVNGGNHTRAFAAAARTDESHRACFNVAKTLAAVGIRVLTDDAYYERVKKTYEEDKAAREKEKQLV